MSQSDLDRQIARATEVEARYADMLLSKPNVVGVGVGFAHKNGQPTREVALVVMVEQKLPLAQLAPEDVIPSELDGVRVDVQATGSFSAADAPVFDAQ